jgi:hypothetical protein
VVKKLQKIKIEGHNKHRRYFQIAGITICVESELDFDEIKFNPEFAPFVVDGPGEDNVTLRHYFELPDLREAEFGREVYREVPWAIYRKNDTWVYRSIWPIGSNPTMRPVAIFSANHTYATIWNTPHAAEVVRQLGWHALSLFPTDQIWLTPLLSDRNSVLLHSAGIIINGRGYLFVGNSEAGKSTTVTMLKNAEVNGYVSRPLSIEILCDDRNVVRRVNESWRVYGTWSHGEVEDVSSASAPLVAVLFLQQDTCNKIVPMTEHKEIWKRLLMTLIKAMVTAEWWQKELNVLEKLVSELRFFTMHFDKSGVIIEKLMNL